MNIGKAVKSARKEKKVSQFFLSKNIKLSVTSIVNLERGDNFPRFNTLKKVSDSLMVTTDYLLLLSIEESSVLEDDKVTFEVCIENLKKIMRKFNDKL